MELDLVGKISVVTGASNGIGRGIALALAKEGAFVVMVARRPEPLRAAAKQVVAIGSAEGHAIDVSDIAAYETFLQKVVDRQQCGGRCLRTHRPIELRAMARRVPAQCRCAVHLPADRFSTHARSGRRRNRQHPMAGVRTSTGANAAYFAAKAGVISLTEYAAVQHAKDNIRVNAIAPGLVRTKMVERLYSKDVQDRMAAATQLIGRIIDPAEIADSVIFLCSERAAMITGMTMPVAGGYNAA